MLRRVFAFAAVLFAAVTLSGCFVASQNLPAGTGVTGDQRLVGTWRGFESKEKKDGDAFLSFLKPNPNQPLRLVWVEDDNYQIYEVRTVVIGKSNVFAAKLMGPAEAMKEDAPKGWLLGFYEFHSADKLTFRMLDSEKVGDLIAKGTLKGTRKPGKYEMANLTGSPAELAAFLASADAQAVLSEEPATLRRLTRAPQ